jgi:hypothetical protein
VSSNIKENNVNDVNIEFVKRTRASWNGGLTDQAARPSKRLVGATAQINSLAGTGKEDGTLVILPHLL